MVHSLVSQFAFFILIATVTLAFFKGGAAERSGAAVVGVSWVCGVVVSIFLNKLVSPRAMELTLLAMDAAMAFGLLLLALRFTKIWLGLAMLVQSGELALHGAAMADWGLQYSVYLLLNNLVSFVLLMLLLGATCAAWIERSKKRSGRTGGSVDVAPGKLQSLV